MSALTLLLENAAAIARTHESAMTLSCEVDEAHEETRACEEALRLGLSFDEAEERALLSLAAADETVARTLTEEEQAAVAAVNASLSKLCNADQVLAQKLQTELEKEAARVEKLEARERKLTEKKLCKADYSMAVQLAADIVAEEQALELRERRDQQLARRLVRESKGELASAPEVLRQKSNEINGPAAAPTMRMRLREKLGRLRSSMTDITSESKGMTDITNKSDL